VKRHGFTVSGVPQLFGDKVALAGAATTVGCTLAGSEITLAAKNIELRKGIPASLKV
jgi:hypothetical protein